MRSHRKRTTAKTTRKHRIALNVARYELIPMVFICMHTNDDVGVEENRKTFSALNLLVVSCARLVALEISFYAQKKTVRKLLDTIYIHNATWILKIICCFLWKLLKLWIFPFDFHQILSFSNWNWNGTIWIRILWIRIQPTKDAFNQFISFEIIHLANSLRLYPFGTKFPSVTEHISPNCSFNRACALFQFLEIRLNSMSSSIYK